MWDVRCPQGALMFIVVDRRQDNPGLCQHIIRSTDMAHINRNGFFV